MMEFDEDSQPSIDKDFNERAEQPPSNIRDTTQTVPDEKKISLTRQEIWNLSFCLLAWAFNICNITLVIGTSNAVVLSINGGARIASVPIGAFFLGSCVISCGITGQLFQTQGRTFTFLVGVAIAMIGTVLGGISLLSKSPELLSIATFCFGGANGIAFFLRFAVEQLVPRDWAAMAIALVVSGGVIAAFAGPETSLATRGLFGPEKHLEYMGVFMMTGIFNVCNAIATSAVTFPPIPYEDFGEGDSFSTWKTVGERITGFFSMYSTLFQTQSFIVPLAVSTLAWAIMAMPMSLVRIAMTQAGYSARSSLLAVEFHFVGMYGSGFITGPLISRFGYKAITTAGLGIFVVSTILSLLIQEDGPLATWIFGMLLLGMGWNFGFTGSTVWLTRCVDTSYSKYQIQVAHDSIMFLLAGVFTFSASSIFEAGGSNVQGWRVVNASIIAFMTLYGSILIFDQVFQHRQKSQPADHETPMRLDSYDESIIEEITLELERERSGPTTSRKAMSAMDIIEELEATDRGTPYPSMEINYGGWTDEEDDTLPPPPPPYKDLHIIDIEEGVPYKTSKETQIEIWQR